MLSEPHLPEWKREPETAAGLQQFLPLQWTVIFDELKMKCYLSLSAQPPLYQPLFFNSTVPPLSLFLSCLNSYWPAGYCSLPLSSVTAALLDSDWGPFFFFSFYTCATAELHHRRQKETLPPPNSQHIKEPPQRHMLPQLKQLVIMSTNRIL